jgi:hypothetical protein
MARVRLFSLAIVVLIALLAVSVSAQDTGYRLCGSTHARCPCGSG